MTLVTAFATARSKAEKTAHLVFTQDTLVAATYITGCRAGVFTFIFVQFSTCLAKVAVIEKSIDISDNVEMSHTLFGFGQIQIYVTATHHTSHPAKLVPQSGR